jgi:hypothetical protein
MWLAEMDLICALVVWVGLGLQSFFGLWRGPFYTASLVDCGVQLVGFLGGLVAFLVSRDFIWLFFIWLYKVL